MMERNEYMKHILLTNDDGYQADGLRQLIHEFKHEAVLTVAAPMEERSGVGHALTIRQPLMVRESLFEGQKIYAVSGTPADCVKLALNKFCERTPDLVISGINQGPNTGINVFYSGTAAAALEACLLGIPSMAVSLASYHSKDFSAASNFAGKIAHLIMNKGIPSRVMINVNVPNLPFNEIKGIRLTVQGKGCYEDNYLERKDPRGRSYYWIDGEQRDERIADGEDDDALRKGWVSVTPLYANLTADPRLISMAEWFEQGEMIPNVVS
jgi:5'-nucleotidase